MLYEIRVAAETDQELADILTKVIEAIRGIPVNGGTFSFTRYPDPDDPRPMTGMRVQGGLAAGTVGNGLPLTPEAFATAAKASQDNAAPAPAKRIGRPPKNATPIAAPTATIVDGPDGEPAAAMEESPFGNAPEEDASTPLTPAQKRDKSIAILQSVFAHPAGPPGVRSLQTKLKVKKFNEVPDNEVDALLSAAEQLYARIQATPGAAA